MRKKPFFNGPTEPNTFIGGLGAVVTTPTALASRLSIESYHIKNFQIDSNNNISCYIGRSYSTITNSFGINPYQNNLFYWIDLDGKLTFANSGTFNNATNPTFNKIVVLPGLANCVNPFSGGGAGTRNKWNIICTPILQPIGVSATTSSNAYSWADYVGKVYVPIFNQTSNAGSPDPDIASAISSGIGAAIKYGTNTDKPNKVTGLYTVSATTSSIRIAWDAVSHTNNIDYYILFRDGVFVNSSNTTSRNVTGLASGTTYEFKVLVVDEMGNTSKKFSDIYSGTTLS